MMILLVLFCIFIFILLALYVVFFITFRRNSHTMTDERVAPQGEQYAPYGEGIIKSVDRVMAEPFEEIYISSRDGVKLHGKYYHHAENAPLVIFFHGYRSGPIRDGNGCHGICKRKGYNTLLVTQRAHGKSEGKTMTFGIKERLDCLDWIAYANERFGRKTPILLMGISMGAATVLMATGEKLPENVCGVVADCPYSAPKDILKTVMRSLKLPADLLYPVARLSARIYGHFDVEETTAVEALKKAQVPILLIHGDDDRFVPCHMSQECYEACASKKQIVLIKGAGHGISYCVDAKSYEEAVNSFLAEVLPA